MVKERKNLGLGLLPIGALFLFNPSLGGVVDVLPDIVGYMLFFVGLRALGDLNYHMEESLACFRRMIIVSGFHLMSIFWLFGFCTPKERPVSILLVTFAVAILELVFAGKAFREMFEGFLYLGSRHGSTAVFEGAGKKKGKATQKISAFTMAFILVKAISPLLPEFSSLTLHSYDERNPLRFLYDYISLLRTFSVIIMLPIGIVWAVKFWRYIRALLRDTPFMDALTEKYRTEILPKEELFLKRAIRFGTVILSVGICFSLDVYLDYQSILPDFLCPIILILGFFALRPYLGNGTRFLISAACHTVSSAAVYFYAMYFYDNFTMSRALFEARAQSAYIVFCILKITDAIFFAAMMLCLLPTFRHLIENYTGFAPINAGNFNHMDKLTYVHGMLKKRIKILLPLSVLCAVGSILYILFVRTVDFIWWVEFFLCFAMVFYFINSMNAITDEVEAKYLLS